MISSPQADSFRRHRPALVSINALVVGAFACSAVAQNFIANPGFESGHAGFGSDYSYSSAGNCCEGQYTVRDVGSTFNGSFVNPPPSSPGSVLFMIVNGATVADQRIWYQTVAVVPGWTYRFSLRGCTAVAGGPAILQWQVNGALVGAGAELPAVTGQWRDVLAQWTAPAGVTSIELVVRNLNTSSFPNDFYIDDLTMVRSCSPSDVAGPNQSVGADGLLTADDIIVFLGWFFAGDTRADVAGANQSTTPDAVFTADDIIVFLGRFFAGC